MTDLDPIIQILIAVIGSGGSIAAFTTLFREWWKSRQARKMDSGFLDIYAVWEELQALATAVGADRALILKSENGGGLPAPGSVIKSTAIFEYHTDVLPSVRSTWDRVLLDSYYSEVVSLISSGAWVWQETKKMPDACILRDLCGETVLVGMARICKTPHALWYVSIHFKGVGEVSEAKKSRMRSGLHKLRVLFGRHHSLLVGEAE